MLIHAAKYLLILFLLGSLYGCHLWGGSKAASIEAKSNAKDRFASKSDSGPSSPVEVQALENGRKTDVEIIWQVPADTADSFTIEYGFDKEKLDQKVNLKPEQLEKYIDPEYGPVYRYVLQNIEPDKDVYVAMITSAGGQTSPPSTVYQAKAATK
jgi:hypothetical protein